MSELAGVLTGKGEALEAEGLCRQALEMMKNAIGEEHPRRLISLSVLAAVLSSQGKYQEAEGMLRRTVELREKVFKSQGKREDAVALMETCYQLQLVSPGTSAVDYNPAANAYVFNGTDVRVKSMASKEGSLENEKLPFHG
ncbi:hypothetical protein CNMCM8694_004916 [Aspergillus lentulus]|nr:hypothetical protein CNMCM8060_003439 [Aspergillus lentulus]KAF4188811.1 hypothetical protein CNMCM7927_000385 [Aspergillus lentulus]KAF4196364.1 hypothetical protein CNMCM8694_004916 [Aspergillus lentulus]